MTGCLLRTRGLLIVFLFLFSLFFAQNLLGLENGPVIKNFTILDRNGTLLASLNLENGLRGEIQDALNSGITVQFSYVFELSRPRFLIDKTIKTVTVVRSLTYDYLKREYRVLFGSGPERMVSVRNEDEAREFACSLKEVDIVDLRSLPQGNVFTLRVKASIKKEESELPFKRLFSLFLNRSIETRWYEIRFRY